MFLSSLIFADESKTEPSKEIVWFYLMKRMCTLTFQRKYAYLNFSSASCPHKLVLGKNNDEHCVKVFINAWKIPVS